MASISIVGGGIAGLTCAWRLQRAGHDVEVLEREATPGGRMRSERVTTPRGAFVVDRGAQFVASGYTNLRSVAEALGLSSRLQRIHPAHNAILRAGRWHAGDYESLAAFLRSDLLSLRTKARLPRLLFELWRGRRELDPYHPERAAALDREDMSAYLRRVVGEEAAEFLFAPAFSSTFDSEPEELSGTFALLAMRFVLSGFRLEAFDGGLGLLPRTLAEQVPVRTGCEVMAVETGDGGARITYRSAGSGRESRVLADAAVVALPGSLVSGVCATLTPEERSFFSSVRYGRGILCFLMTDRAPATIPGYGVAFPRREHAEHGGLGLYGLAVDHAKRGVAPAGAGLFNVSLTAAAAAQHWDAPDDAIVAFVLAALARTPVGRIEPIAHAVHRWDPMLPQFYAGYLPRLARFGARRERSPRLAFAGDYLIGPYTEMALTSGMRAATDAVRWLD
ncbi:FAD-dependent oxidoreductase [Myxococcota bacterium]|nr:FAD-dependent oxidoreductase [Myxococcota bacterium]MCZ7620293.1 FAD-dependent oxidoreductase [Myxococcota bacterium]